MTTNKTSFKPVVPSSPHYDAIMADFEKYGWEMNHADFWRQYVNPKDPNIKQGTWASYSRRYQKRNKQKKDLVPVKTTLTSSTSNQSGPADMKTMQKNTIEFMMEIGSKTLQELAEDEEAMKKVPIKERLNLLKDAMKLNNDIQSLALKQKKDEREQTLFEEIMNGAQYGDIEEDEIVEGEIVEEEEKEDEPKQIEEAPSKPHVEILSPLNLSQEQYGNR